MQQGELVVTGHNHIDIVLLGYPSKVRASFKDKHHHVVPPCNPGDVDFLECEVHYTNLHLSGFLLRITWRVSSVREIVWRVEYDEHVWHSHHHNH